MKKIIQDVEFFLPYLTFVCWFIFAILSQARAIKEEETSAEKMSPSGWLVGEPLGSLLISDWCERTRPRAPIPLRMVPPMGTWSWIAEETRPSKPISSSFRLSSRLEFLACCALMITCGVNL